MRSSINLFSTRASIPQWVLTLDPYIPLINVLAVSFVVAGTLAYLVGSGILALQERSVEISRQKAMAQLVSLQQKEMKYLVMKQRIPIVENIIKTQKSLAPYIDTALAIATPPQLQSISPGEKQQVSLRVALPTIEDGIPLLGKIIDLSNQNIIRSPSLSNVTVSKEGIISVGITYTVRL